MGDLDVRIRHRGGSGLSLKAILGLAVALMLAASGAAILHVVAGMFVALLWWLFGVFAVAIVCGTVLACVFRDRIRAPRLIYRSREPVEAIPGPREVHIHYHGQQPQITPGGLYQQMPGWGQLVEAEVVDKRS